VSEVVGPVAALARLPIAVWEFSREELLHAVLYVDGDLTS
jgi:hypothetical protein